MMALPAVDLREGACVQLVGGDYDREAVRIDDPLGQALRFRDMGFRALHVVDLDAATGRGDNAKAVARIARGAGLGLQVGGGVRSLERADELFDLGVERVVVGTRAVEDVAFLEALVAKHPGRVVVAVDVRSREVVTRGWAERTGRSIFELADELSPLPAFGLLVTAVHREGALGGVDAPLYRELCQRTARPVVASGGVTTMADLEELRLAGCSAAVIGMALYREGGALDGRAVAAEYGQ